MFVVADENAKKQGKSTNLKAVVAVAMMAGAMGGVYRKICITNHLPEKSFYAS